VASLSRSLPRVDGTRVLFAIVLVGLLWLVILPLYFVVRTSLTPDTLRPSNDLTLANYADLLKSDATYSLLLNSLVFALGSNLIALPVGGLLAWIVERTNTPCKVLAYVAAYSSLAIPGVLKVIGWILLLGPQAGIVNVLVRSARGTDDVFFNLFSMPGMVLVEGLTVITVVGARGIGGPLAAFLKLAGERVQVVEVGPHLAAIRARGLCVQGVRGEHHIAFDSVCAPEEVRGPLELVFIATRANRTDAVVEAILPHLTTDALVVSTQNGLNALTIAPRIGAARTIPGMVHMVGAVTEPGVVCRYTEGEFYLGEFCRPAKCGPMTGCAGFSWRWSSKSSTWRAPSVSSWKPTSASIRAF
jgi:hypothetical protein